MLTVNAYAAPSATDPLVPVTIIRRDLGSTDVLIAIRYAGICHSDIHTVRGEWGPITYPQVVGHEIVAEVIERGAAVTRFAAGDRVGVGCMVNSCRECENCLAGEEQYCLTGNTGTYASLDRDGTGGPSPDPTSAPSPRPRRCWTSAPSTGSHPRPS